MQCLRPNAYTQYESFSFVTFDVKADPGRDAICVEPLQKRCIPIQDALDDVGSVFHHFCKHEGILLWHLAIQRWNAMPVGIVFRMPQLCSNALLEPLGDEMLKTLSLFMNFLHWVIQDFVEKGLDQPMMSQYF